MNPWLFVYEGFDPEEEDLREALCTLGNGYFATRGAASEAEADEIHYPGTYLACGYNRLQTEIAGRTVENEDLVNLPNWLPLSFRIADGKWFNLMAFEILSYRQELDLKRGILLRTVRFRDQEGRETTVANRRLVHMGTPHLAALETRVMAENWTGKLEVCSALDGRVVNAGVERYKGLKNDHLEPLEADAVGEEAIYIKVQTNQSELHIAQTARTRVLMDGKPLEVRRRTVREPEYIGHRFTVDVAEGSAVTIEKVVSLYTSRDHAISECGREAKKAIGRAGSFDELVESHALAWEHLWSHFDIEFQQVKAPEEDRKALILHLYTFHLLQTTSIHTMDLDVGVPSRGWHGEAYRGHIFWDELFIFPLLNLRIPEITRALLMYRYRRLDEARATAREAGYRGAMYPWQSGSNGREESQQLHLNPKSGRWIPDNSHLQRHVNAAIAYNVWQYYQVTGDTEFLSFYGAEMILEIARFWASIATYNGDLDRYEILGVMGPDEYHDGYPDAEKPGLNNNAYTNIMATWVLWRALELLNLLPEDQRKKLCERLELDQEEIQQWRDLSHKMRLVFHDDGVISQFEGYDQLAEFDWEGYHRKYDDIQRLDRILEAEGDTPNRYKASKQADVLMLFYLFSSEELGQLFQRLGYPFEYETIPKNIDYYLRRTSHGSTLSWVAHAWVLARSDRTRSWKLFNEALQSDVADIQGGTTPEGIHLGAMAGTVDLIQRGYSGIEARGDVLWFNPCLPEELEDLRMQIRYRGHSLSVQINSDNITVSAFRCTEEPIKIGVKDQVFDLREGDSQKVALEGSASTHPGRSGGY
jgi:alpha,alpha-trehalase